MFCPKCGTELPDGSQFCLKCGHALNGPTPPQPAKTSRRVLWVVLPLLLVMLVWWSIKSYNPTQGSSAEQPITAHAPAISPTATATEIFNLRSECARLGQKILHGNIVGVALTQDQVSHYDPQTNRCYVQLTVQTADLSKPGDYFSTTLYDGQTGEILAFARTEHGKKSGMVFDGSLPDGQDPDRFWNHATDFINGKMEDDRKN